MINYVLYPIIELRGFIILSVAVLILLTLAVLFLMGKKKTGMNQFGWQGMFLGMKRRETVQIALGISQLLFVLSVIIFSVSMGTVQIAAIAILCVAKGILTFSPAAFGGEVIYGILMGVALMIENLLKDYMRETGVELYIGIIWILLVLFILQYSLYYFIKSLERMLMQHEKAAQKKIHPDIDNGDRSSRHSHRERRHRTQRA